MTGAGAPVRLGHVADYSPSPRAPRRRLGDRGLTWLRVTLRDRDTGERYEVTAGAHDADAAVLAAQEAAHERGIRAAVEGWVPAG